MFSGKIEIIFFIYLLGNFVFLTFLEFVIKFYK